MDNMNSTSRGVYSTVTVYVDRAYYNGTEAVIVVQDIRDANTGEMIRDHINVNAANNMAILEAHIGSTVTIRVQWKAYRSGKNICFETVVSIA